MKLEIKSYFPADFDKVVKLVNQSATLDYIARPLIKFYPVEPESFPVIWENKEYLTEMKLFGIFPIGKQIISISRPRSIESNQFILRDNGKGDSIKMWDHWITIKKDPISTSVLYIDKLFLKAGILTPFIWLFANVFYRWRQFRWKFLINI
jgi:hypothetical protein